MGAVDSGSREGNVNDLIQHLSPYSQVPVIVTNIGGGAQWG